MGLGPPEEPRLNAVNMAPRLCHMSAGGPRRFTVGDAEFARAVSPYELEFHSGKPKNLKDTFTSINIINHLHPIGESRIRKTINYKVIELLIHHR